VRGRDAEQIFVNLSFGRVFEAVDPLTPWAQSTQAAWLAARLPWLEATRMMGCHRRYLGRSRRRSRDRPAGTVERMHGSWRLR
jgi:hypothetical protein